MLLTCDHHGNGAIVAYMFPDHLTCPACDAIEDLERDISQLNETIEELEQEIEVLNLKSKEKEKKENGKG